MPRPVHIPGPVRICLALLVCASTAFAQAPPRTPDIHYTPTRHEVAEAMLELAGVSASDIVYDLGSGDGRLPIIAAQKYGARGVGVDIDPQLVRLARQNARNAGVTDRVVFFAGDLFATDLSDATVITLYLSPSIMRRLEPMLAALHPGTRIVAHQFEFPRWKPEQTQRVGLSDLFLYRVP